MAFNFNTDDIFSGAKGSANAIMNTTVNVGKTSEAAASTGSTPNAKQSTIVDHRAKINIKPNDLSRLTAAANQKDGNKTPHPSTSVLGSREDKTNILAPLFDTNGVVFPYTPLLVNSTHTAVYADQNYTHSNYSQQAFSYSDVTNLSIEATFTSQTEDEARYTIAAIHFFRTVTKMYTGGGPAGKLGGPPPVLLFNYLGNMFHNMPIVITSFTPTFPADNDIVTIMHPEGDISVPTIMSVNIVFRTQYNPYLMKDKKKGFNLDHFREGKLLKKGYI